MPKGQVMIGQVSLTHIMLGLGVFLGPIVELGMQIGRFLRQNHGGSEYEDLDPDSNPT